MMRLFFGKKPGRIFFPALLAGLLLLPCCSGEPVRDTSMEKPDRLYHQLATFYEQVRETPLSSALKADLEKIVEARLDCYLDEQGYDGRLQECRNNYLTATIAMARQKVPAAPLLGNFILCIQDCPISHAICAGEHSYNNGVDCVAIESRCLEHCLDLYWRGGVTETRAGRTRAVGMPDKVGGRVNK